MNNIEFKDLYWRNHKGKLMEPFEFLTSEQEKSRSIRKLKEEIKNKIDTFKTIR